jgi:predicted NUDIX family NTP pyrophosphohydrolase
MPKQSAGLMMYRKSSGLEVFLVHPGGPLWAKRDQGAWTIPKGGREGNEEPVIAAQREFCEETGFTPTGPFHELGSIRQKSGKIVTAWAFEGDCDPAALKSNTCKIEWPRGSKCLVEIPEVDRGCWFTLDHARDYIREEQRPLLDALQSFCHSGMAKCTGSASYMPAAKSGLWS